MAMDEKLLDALGQARAGISSAYALLVERFSPVLKAIGRHYLQDAGDVEDAVQEVWEKIFKNIEALREPERFPGWVAGIMRYHCLNRVKRDRKLFEVCYEDVSAHLKIKLAESYARSSESLEAYVVSKELRAMVRNVLASMPEPYSLPLYLHYFEEMDLAGIGEITGLPVSTLKWRLYHGRLLFRKFIMERYFMERY